MPVDSPTSKQIRKQSGGERPLIPPDPTVQKLSFQRTCQTTVFYFSDANLLPQPILVVCLLCAKDQKGWRGLASGEHKENRCEQIDPRPDAHEPVAGAGEQTHKTRPLTLGNLATANKNNRRCLTFGPFIKHTNVGTVQGDGPCAQGRAHAGWGLT